MHKIRVGLLALATLVVAGLPALAQSYPDHTIKMVVPFPPGGPSDVVARIIADGMSRAMGGASVIIENVGGAGGTIGTARVAEATPDGYTLLGAGMGSHVAAPALFPNLRYDSTKDFAPIGLASNSPVAVVAKKDTPAKNLKEFIAEVKKGGKDVKQAHGGIGSASHMACLLFNTEAGLKPSPIPYSGTGPALNDLIGGHVDYFCEQVVSVQGAIKGGTVKGYVVSGNSRSPAIPDVPSAKEAGLPNLSDQHLERDLRAQGHAEAGPRQAQRCLEQGAGRSGGGQASGRPRRHRAGQGRARPAASRGGAQGRYRALGSDPEAGDGRVEEDRTGEG